MGRRHFLSTATTQVIAEIFGDQPEEVLHIDGAVVAVADVDSGMGQTVRFEAVIEVRHVVRETAQLTAHANLERIPREP